MNRAATLDPTSSEDPSAPRTASPEPEMAPGVISDALIAEGVTPTPYTAPVPAPPDISDRQFGRGLWGAGIISYTDYLGFIGPGILPAAITAILSTLADDDTGTPTPRKEATGFLTGAKTFQFAHPLVEVFREAMAASDPKWTPDYLRTEWLAWSDL